MGLAQRRVELLDLRGQLRFSARGPVPGAGLERLPATGEELVTPLRHRHRRGALPPCRLRDCDLAPQHSQNDPRLVLHRLRGLTAHQDPPSSQHQTMTCLKNLDTRQRDNTPNHRSQPTPNRSRSPKPFARPAAEPPSSPQRGQLAPHSPRPRPAVRPSTGGARLRPASRSGHRRQLEAADTAAEARPNLRSGPPGSTAPAGRVEPAS